MAKLRELTEEEYWAVEDALSSNAEGRAFLRMRDRRSQAVGLDEIRRLVRTMRSQQQPAALGDGGISNLAILRQELRDMSGCVEQTRREVAALRGPEGSGQRISTATGEIDAIVSTTERATSNILNCAERIGDLADKLPSERGVTEIRDEISGQATEILMACSFHDITGQRMTKVINTLRYLEARVNSMLEIWDSGGRANVPVPEMPDRRPPAEKHLLNGPSEDGIDQSLVDSLMFGAAAPEPPREDPPREDPPRDNPVAETPALKEPQAAPPPTPVPTAANDVAPHTPKAEPPAEAPVVTINQADIDALFA